MNEKRDETPLVPVIAKNEPNSSEWHRAPGIHDEKHPKQTEGGPRAWLVVAACTFLQFLVSAYRGYGIFYVVLLDYFDKSKWETALAGSICVGTTFTGGPIASALCNLLSHRVTCMIGCIVTTIGYIASAFAPNLYFLYFSYGFLVGLGNACVTIPASVMAGFYFEKKLRFVTGVVVAGFGVGALLFPLIVQYLQVLFSWRGAMIILGGIALQGCVAGALMVPKQQESVMRDSTGENEMMLMVEKIDGPTRREDCQGTTRREDCQGMQDKLDSERKDTKSHRNATRKYCDISLLKNVGFLFLILLEMVRAVHAMIVFATLPDKVISEGLTQYQAAYLLVFAGISSTVWRVLIGIILNFCPSRTTIIFGVICTMQGAAILPLSFNIPYFEVESVLSIVYGGLYGMLVTLLPLLIIEHYGLEKLTMAFGYCVMGAGIGSFVGLPFAGILYDIAGNYFVPFLTACAVGFLGGILTIPVYLLRRRGHHKDVECK